MALPVTAASPPVNVRAKVRFSRPVAGVAWHAGSRSFIRLVGAGQSLHSEAITTDGAFSIGAASPAGDFVLGSDAGSQRLALIDVRSGRRQETRAAPGVRQIVFSPLGSAAVLLRGASPAVEVIRNLPVLKLESYSLPAGSDLASVAVADDGTLVAAASSGELLLLTGSAARPIGRLTPPVALAFAPSSHDLAAADGSGAVILFGDVEGNLSRRALWGGTVLGSPVGVTFSRDGQTVFAAGGQATLLALRLSDLSARFTSLPAAPTVLRRVSGNAIFQIAETGSDGILLADVESNEPRVWWHRSRAAANAAPRLRENAPAAVAHSYKLLGNGAVLQSGGKQSPDSGVDVWVTVDTPDTVSPPQGSVAYTYTIDAAELARFGTAPPAQNQWVAGDGKFALAGGRTAEPVGLTKTFIAAGKYSFTITDDTGKEGPPVDITVAESEPVSIKCYQWGSTLTITGATPTLDLKTLTLGYSNSQIGPTSVDLGGFATWFKGTALDQLEPYGAFKFDVALTVSNGAIADLGTTSATISNSNKAAPAVTCQAGTPTASSTLPVISSAGVVNSASYMTGPVAPGEGISIFGVNLPSSAAKATLFSPDGKTTASATVTGSVATQMNVVLPASLPDKTVIQLQVGDGKVASNSIWLQVAPTAPGVYTNALFGPFNSDGTTLNSATNPATAGQPIVFHLTGEGVIGADGKPVADVSVSISGKDAVAEVAETTVAGSQVAKITAQIPAGITARETPVVITAGGVQAQALTIFVK